MSFIIKAKSLNRNYFLSLCNGAAVVIHAFLRSCLYTLSLSMPDDASAYLKRMLAGSTIMNNVYQLFKGSTGAPARWSNCFKLSTARGCMHILFIAIMLAGSTSCQYQVKKGIKKDFNTGLKTEYKNIEPEEAVLVMNDEVLGHTDIPLGEQFTIINKGVKGLTEKEGKVSVGCSLLITDMKGTVILDEQDLFKDNGVVDAGKSEYLKCMVSTGEPMAWDEQYKIKAGFWDKWGDGKIVNEVTIRMIDVP